MIKIQLVQLEQIQTHAVTVYPEECCGLLLGKNTDNVKITAQIWETENNWESEAFRDIKTAVTPKASKRNRFSIAPIAMLEAQKKARDHNLDIIGIYHSHPDHLAIPSEFDRAIAHQCYSYLIISVQQGKPQDIFSWVLDEQHQFQSEEIITI